MKREGKMFDSVSYEKQRRDAESRVKRQKFFFACITTVTLLFIGHVIGVELLK